MALGAITALSFGAPFTANAGMLGGDDISTAQMSQVKVSITDAIQKSLKKHHGTVVSADLENEDGRLVYEIEYLNDGKEMEVLVDAVTGEVMSGNDD